MGGRELKGGDPAHRVAHDDGSVEIQLVDHIGHVGGELRNRILARRLVAVPVATQVDGNRSEAQLGEIVGLGCKVGVVAAPAVHEEQGPVSGSPGEVGEANSVADDTRHRKPPDFPFSRQ